MNEIDIGGPIHRYLSITGITLEEFFERVRNGDSGATSMLAAEAIHCSVNELVQTLASHQAAEIGRKLSIALANT